ncbi:MAG: hypothetical protein C5B58_03570 [Acidobacteria bacterium]|nr:MAG: hypothetical protein C5B58_03570 [Acidobacteriota bacterium]
MTVLPAQNRSLPGTLRTTAKQDLPAASARIVERIVLSAIERARCPRSVQNATRLGKINDPAGDQKGSAAGPRGHSPID